MEVLERNGFGRARSGKHITFKKVDAGGKVWTPWVPHHREVTIFVLRYMARQTGKSREEFL